MSGKWLWLDMGQECSQCTLLVLMEHLFVYRGLENNHKICTEFSDVAETIRLCWVESASKLFSILLRNGFILPSSYLTCLKFAFALYITDSSLNCYCC